MRDIVSAAYTKSGQFINVVLQDQPPDVFISVPDTMDNKDRVELAEWEDAGNTIAPYVEPAQTPEETRIASFVAAPEAADLATRARTATPAQIDAWLTANVTTLAQARTVLGALIKQLVANGAL